MQKRTFLDYIFISLRGLAMGAADIVPGVSGGTIAFISGIYEELINSINNINTSLLTPLKNRDFKGFWKQANGNFLLSLLLGIIISIISLAKLVSTLLENHPIPLWAFFFGLVLASVIFVGKEIKKWNLISCIALIFGAIIAYYITILPPLGTTDSLWFVFLSGALAICAMILPGISGSFILVLLGSYQMILDAVHERNFKIIITFGIGILFGLFSFARILKWMFSHYKNTTLALLTGFILGSLNKIWPWKETLSWYTGSHGEQKPLLQKSISPFQFEGDNQIILALLLAIVGFSLIFILEKLAKKKH